MQEFESPFYGQKLVEEHRSPFCEEPSHEILFEDVKKAFNQANQYIQNFWGKLRSQGLPEVLSIAKDCREPIDAEFTLPTGETATYELSFEMEKTDIFGQFTDLFSFSKITPGILVKKLSLATAATGGGSPFENLAVLSMEDAEQPMKVQQFHFFANNLLITSQVTRAGVLFPPDEHNKDQIFQAMLKEQSSEVSELTVRTGYKSLLENEPYYVNLGGTAVLTDRIKVSNVLTGTIDLLDSCEDTPISSFRLPMAIVNTAHFTPATA